VVLQGTALKRFRHVVSEGRRVDLAQAAMVRGDLATFGTLLRQSHASLRNDYEVSCPELDELVTLAEAGGAVGARLTGAGFGGCIVAVAHRDRVEEVMAELNAGFYLPRGIHEAVGNELFAAVPAAGASVGPATA
jgi:galactokinase